MNMMAWWFDPNEIDPPLHKTNFLYQRKRTCII